MKQLILILAILMLSPVLLFSQKEKVKIYGITIKAKDIFGQNQFSGSQQNYYYTKVLDPLPNRNITDYLKDLGTYRSNYKIKETLPLFDLSSDINDYPLLDTIDFDFYKNVGFDKVLARNPSMKTNSLFTELRDTLNKITVTKDKKAILFLPKYSNIKNELLISRFDTTSHPFEIDQKKVNISTVTLKASLDTIIINNSIQASADLYGYIHSLADEHVKLFGIYYDAYLDPKYIGKINYFIKNTPVINLQNDQFAFYLKEYIPSKVAAANTELVAIQVTGTYDKTKVNSDSIAFNLATKFQIPQEKAYKIAASISLQFSKNQTTTISSTFNTLFIIRYFTSKVIDDLTMKELLENKLNKFQ